MNNLSKVTDVVVDSNGDLMERIDLLKLVCPIQYSRGYLSDKVRSFKPMGNKEFIEDEGIVYEMQFCGKWYPALTIENLVDFCQRINKAADMDLIQKFKAKEDVCILFRDKERVLFVFPVASKYSLQDLQEFQGDLFN